MQPTEILMTEHKAVLMALGILEEAGQALVFGSPTATQDLAQLLDFFRGFVDRCHHAKEEMSLFPELVKRGVPQEGGPVGVMLSEHEKGREHVRRIQASLEAFERHEAGAAAQALDAIQAYRTLLEAHIQKEDRVLFPMADRLLDAQRANELVQDFNRIELEDVGAGKHEAYHQMLHTLQKQYLS
jgi:hemerythrin-like domain-containing protein